MRSPEEARIRKLEERNEELRGAIEEAIDHLEDTSRQTHDRIRWAKRMLEPYDLRSKNGGKDDG